MHGATYAALLMIGKIGTNFTFIQGNSTYVANNLADILMSEETFPYETDL